jgi:hypothetical protein
MTQGYLADVEIDHYIRRILGQCANPNYDIYPWLGRQLAQGLVVVKVDDRRGIVLYGDRHRGKPHAWVLFDDGVTKSVRLSRDCLVFGAIRQIYYPGRIRAGTYGIMGAISKGIRSGRAFRGR